MSLKSIYKSSTVELISDTTQSFILYKNLKSDEQQTEASYKDALLAYGRAFEEYPYSLSLADSRFSTFTIPPELQQWTTQMITPKTASLQRSAIVLSKDIFQVVSVQQLIEEIDEPRGVLNYFEELKKAQEWLFEGKGGWPYLR